MTWAERKNFQPTDPWRRSQQDIDIAINDAMQQNRNSPDRLARDGHYLVTDPWPMLNEIGDFVEENARAAWDDIRETWGTGVQLTNQLRQVFSDQCADDWHLIIETALPAAGAALMLLLTPSPGEILENYLEPKALKSGGRGPKDKKKVRRKKGRSGRLRRSFPRFPDVDRLIADRLPGRKAVEGRRATTPTRWVFSGINTVDRFLWHWLLYEAGKTFITQWNSGLREARFCTETALSAFRANYEGRPVSPIRICPFEKPQLVEIQQEKNVHCDQASAIRWIDSQGNGYTAGSGQLTTQVVIPETDEASGGELDFQIAMETYDQFGGIVNSEFEVFDHPEGGGNNQGSLSIDLAGAQTAVSNILWKDYVQGVPEWDHNLTASK